MEKEKLVEWVNGCRQNDRGCQEKLYRYFFSRIFAHVRRYCRDEQDAVSIVNDGFLKAFMFIHTYSFELGEFESWLTKVVTNATLDHLRRKKKALRVAELDDSIVLKDNSHLQVVKPEYLYGLINKLPSLTKSVLSLNIEGYSHREISGLLNISELSSRWHLSQAKRQLRKQLEQVE